MGKQSGRSTKKKSAAKHEPLSVQMKNHKEATPKGKKLAMQKRLQRMQKGTEEDLDTCGHGGLERGNDGFMMPNKVSALILKQARDQREEMDAEMAGDDEEDAELEYDEASSVATETPFEEYEDIEVDEEEARLMEQFAPQSGVQSRNLADIIMAKIRQKERDADDAASRADGASSRGGTQFDARVVKIYKTVGKLLKRYTTGKIPKAFKVLPNLQGWEELLWLTSPHEWSPHALYAATRLFAHTANEKMTQRFYNGILLPSIRASFKQTGKLHSHSFAALRKALWKPGAFNKGFLLPLAAEPDLTMKEALVVSSVLSRASMPMAHAMVAVAKIAQMPYNGSSSIIMRMLLDKGYDMPYAVIDLLVKHFHQFTRETRELPVLWHQCLLTFVQRYKEHFMEEQVSLIRKTVNKHNHPLISSEVRRELIQLENEWRKMGGCPARKARAPLQMVH
eukprot:TRINITY_DN34765_c0_g1_i1.p2 TRINITY_DN34765_c0_g1~~TRINITY_DN34765_c0_g1_i1.p2  ORF type:complete len:452 (+),score=204.61 TRINITY_DN34765_c0_g1_i1:127-1482(+)